MTGPLSTLSVSLYLMVAVCGFVAVTYALAAELSRAAHQWCDTHPDVRHAEARRRVWRSIAWLVLVLAVAMTVAAWVAGEVGR